MRAILRRLESGERCWCAECASRGFGAALLGLCATAFCWLHRSITQPAGILDLAVAVLAVCALSLGLALAFEGPTLFRVFPASAHRVDFTP